MDRAGQQLVDVSLSLIVNAAPPNIADFDRHAPWQFALNGGVPIPCRGDLKYRILNRHRERELARHGTRRGIRAAVDHDLLWLKRSVPAERGVPIDRGPVREHAYAGADRSLAVDTKCQAKARLEDRPVCLGESFR